MSKTLTQIGKNIRKLRNEKDWSIRHFADLLETDSSYLGRVERGQQNVSIKQLEKIADLFSIKVIDLFK
ncbi:transcriptional regulator [Chitinophaga caeni]|uniref:Transcriptional regulator n=1 Tax=Chitinophaga caeni TaxID=2029983 RepID=A0A291QW80_9BACT|nr:helix-turn-helix transcriptional regulator [Chitinophaga caeni]ATL48181.1 transcriptional regulator [Chitinophaga caeni]